jgi:hypothetical protein
MMPGVLRSPARTDLVIENAIRYALVPRFRSATVGSGSDREVTTESTIGSHAGSHRDRKQWTPADYEDWRGR